MTQPVNSSKSFTYLFDFYAPSSSSVVPTDDVAMRRKLPRCSRLPPVSSNSYQVPAAPNSPSSSCQLKPEEVAESPLLRTMSERRRRMPGPADVTSQLRPLLLVQTYEADSRATDSASPPASAPVVMETKKALLSSPCFVASIWLL